MGSPADQGAADERPLHRVNVSAFSIDRYEVTNARYAACVKAGACARPVLVSSAKRHDYFDAPEFGNYPVVFVSWEQANAFCRWDHGRLPTEAEWELAARGPAPSRRVFPWGDEPADCSKANMGGPTAAWAIRIWWAGDLRERVRGVPWISQEMSGSGRPTGTTRVTTFRVRITIRRDRTAERSRSCVEDAGRVVRIRSGSRAAKQSCLVRGPQRRFSLRAAGGRLSHATHHVLGDIGAALTALVLTAGEAQPCGGAFGYEYTISPSQQIVVGYRDGVETYVFNPHFCGQASSFGLILPVPAVLSKKPELHEPALYTDLAAVAAPTIETQEVCLGHDGVAGGRSTGTGGSASNGGGTTVIETGTVGVFDYALLQAETTASFTDWLDTNGFPYEDSAQEAFDHYVQSGWYFVAFKCRRTRARTGPAAMAPAATAAWLVPRSAATSVRSPCRSRSSRIPWFQRASRP